MTLGYDITFSASADKYKRRRPRDVYHEFRMLPADAAQPDAFFVSKEYMRLACQLTEAAPGPRYMYFNSAREPEASGAKVIRYVTRPRINWQYECATAFAAGRVSPEDVGL